MDRLTVVFLSTLCVLTGFVVVVFGYSREGYPIVFGMSQSILFAFLPPLFGSLVGVLVGNLIEQRRVANERRRGRDALLANIRAECDQNMILIMNLFNPHKVFFIRTGDEPLSEKLYTQTWESCINSGQAILLGFEERGMITLVYSLIRDYNERDWSLEEDPSRRERALRTINDQVGTLATELRKREIHSAVVPKS